MFGISKNLGVAIGILALIVLIAFLGWRTMATIDGMVTRAETRATEAEAARWKAEIERANAEAEKKIAEQARASLAIEADANARINQVTQDYEELRKRSEALPHGTAVGLSRERGRLLSK